MYVLIIPLAGIGGCVQPRSNPTRDDDRGGGTHTTESAEETGTTVDTQPIDTSTAPLSWVAAGMGSDAKACGLVSDGTMRCWGERAWEDAAPPVTERFVQFSIGGDAACAVRETGELACWCVDAYDTAGHQICLTKPSGTFERVEVGVYSACAQREDGTLQCFGMPMSEPPPEPAIDFALESESACGVFQDGRLTCWDAPPWGQGIEEPDGTFTKVATGRNFVCGIDLAGDMRCAGRTWDGGFAPDLVVGPFGQIDAQYLTTCGIRPDGHPGCWYSSENSATYGPVPDEAFAQLGLGDFAGCAVLLTGEAICWGGPPSTLDVPEL